MYLAPLVVAFLLPVCNANPTYDGYRIYSITPRSAQEARNLQKRFSSYHTHPIRNTLSVAIPPDEVVSFEALGFEGRLVNEDLGKYIRSIDDRHRIYDNHLHRRGELPALSWFDTYHDYADHLTYWDDLVQAFPENSEKFEIGKSYENRSIYAFRIHGDTKEGYGKTERPVILWHATVHAREVSNDS
jgi:hypothetical protein